MPAFLQTWPTVLLVSPFVAVLTGVVLAKQSARRYWRWAAAVTFVLSTAFFVSATARDVPHPALTALILTGMSVTIPVLATFGIERVTATAPRWIALGVGLLAYVPIVLITVAITMQLGELLSGFLPGVEISIP